MKAFDTTASIMCQENDIDCVMVALKGEDSILNALEGKGGGTVVSNHCEVEYY